MVQAPWKWKLSQSLELYREAIYEWTCLLRYQINVLLSMFFRFALLRRPTTGRGTVDRADQRIYIADA